LTAAVTLPACLAAALARAGEAAVRTAGPESLRVRLDAALAGELDGAGLDQLCADLDRFAGMLDG
jgi:hypothetical protein